VLPLALEARRKGKFEALCPSEDSFPELYKVLGSQAAQDEIRRANPDVKHCELLRVNPTICDKCPVNQNPYNGDEGHDGELYRAVEQYGHWLEEAILLDDYRRLGLSPPPQELSPEQFEVLRVMHRDEQLIKVQLLGQEIARVIARMFSKKEK
jgi:hypothetical protein